MDIHYEPTEGSGFDWKTLTLFLITVGIVVVCALMLRPLVPAITGAVVLAIVTQRAYQWIASRQRNATLAAAFTLILVILCIITPAIFLARNLGHHLLAVMHSVQNGTAEQAFHTFLNRSPHIAAALHYSTHNVNLRLAIEKGAGVVAAKSARFLGGSLTTAAQIIIMLFLLFFLYRDRDRGLSALRSILPFNDDEMDYLLSRIAETIRVTVLGRFVVAGAQGVVAGITFASLGISGASVLGIMTGIFAVVPSFGAFVVWLPVAIYLAATDHWIRAVVLVSIGALIISTLDNVLYPILVGTRLRLHTVPMFLSILGGVWLFGISGLVIGPVVFTLTESLLMNWSAKARAGTTAP